MTNKQIQFTLYEKSLITKKVILDFNNLGRNIAETLTNHLRNEYENRCQEDGFIRKGSCNVQSYSAGVILDGVKLAIEVVFECETHFPVEGMLLQCLVKNITKAGLTLTHIDENNSPFVAHILREHYINGGVDMFSNVKENDQLVIRVIGQKFQLFDKYITIIAEFT